MSKSTSYGVAIREGFEYLLKNYPKVFVMGQGLWSPWYVGNSMTNIDKNFGKDRVLDTPVAEDSCTGMAIGASLCGYRPIVVHPRIDFMILATNQIVNQAAKWSHMLGGQAHPAVTIRGIVNRGGEQGAQHSQALHSWYAHVPGLRVVTPATAADARDLLIASVLCDDPVVYIDDRWLYDIVEDLPEVRELDLTKEGPVVRRPGSDITLVGSGHTAHECLRAATALDSVGISCEVIDLRVLNPLNPEVIIQSVQKTGRLCCVDGSWANCGMAAEIIASVSEHVLPSVWKAPPKRATLPAAPAPTSRNLERDYYAPIRADGIADTVRSMF
jgi:pyruvate/2-oxoglutarate/acetoin dehydrogenase E1 component